MATPVLPAIRTTDGTAIAVSDDAILEGQSVLARSEGLLCEPTAAVVIAALSHLPDANADTRVCCVVTGNGPQRSGGYPAARPGAGYHLPHARRAGEDYGQ